MWGKIIKRMAAVALSTVLAAEIIGDSCLLDIKAEEISINSVDENGVVATFELKVNGYKGENLLEFGEVILRLFEGPDMSGSYIDMKPDSVSVNIDENTLIYNCTFEEGRYRALCWYLKAGTEESYIRLKGVVGVDVFQIGVPCSIDSIISRYCFFDGKNRYYETYHYGNNGAPASVFKAAGTPQKNNHIFLGWSETPNGNLIVDIDLQPQPTYIGEYYAVWEHPGEETWDWNSDNENHWKECSCEELKTEAEAHVWNDGIITRQPTDTLEGETTYTCADCGKTRIEPIPATGSGHVHMEDEGTITKAPTETEDGVKTYLCKECGYVMRTETLPATGKPTVSGNDSVSGNDPALPVKPDVPENPGTPVNPDLPGNADAPINADVPGSSQASEANPTNETVNQNHTGTATAASVNSVASNGRNGEPKTGEIPYIEIYATTAMIAGMAYLFFYFRDEERGMSEEEKTELVARLVAWAKKGGYFRRIAALTAIFFLLCYYHSIGKRVGALEFSAH